MSEDIDLMFHLSFDVLDPVEPGNAALFVPCTELREWCEDNLSEPVVYSMGRMRFYATMGNETDAVYFKLRWGDWCVFR